MPAQKGFTLVELLVVIAIIAILAVVGVTVFSGVQKSARISKTISDLRTLSQTYTRYYIENGKPPPFDHSWSMGGENCVFGSGNFTPKPATWNGPYYMTIPNNAWGGEYHFDHNIGGFSYSISIHNIPPSDALSLDKSIDDNNLASGKFIQSSSVVGDNRYEYQIGTDWATFDEHIISCTP